MFGQNKVEKRNSTRRGRGRRTEVCNILYEQKVLSLSFVENYSAQPICFLIIAFWKQCSNQTQRKQSHFFCKHNITWVVYSFIKIGVWGGRGEERRYLFSWGWRITFLTMVVVLLVTMMTMVVVLMRLIVCWRSNKTLRCSHSCFLGLLVVTSIVEDDGESLGGSWISRVPFPKFWQLSSFVSLHTTTQKKTLRTGLFIISESLVMVIIATLDWSDIVMEGREFCYNMNHSSM